MINNVLIPCKTMEDAKRFAEAAEAFGLKWILGDIPTASKNIDMWNVYEENTIYYIMNTRICYGDFNDYKYYDHDVEYKVYSVDEFINKVKGQKLMTAADLKPGMLLKIKNLFTKEIRYGLVEDWIMDLINVRTERNENLNPENWDYMEVDFLNKVIEIYSESSDIKCIDTFSTNGRELLWKELEF